LADAGDQRFVEYRYVNSRPIAQLLIGQMDGEPSDADAPCADVATVVLTSFERLSTVITNPPFPAIAAMSGVIPGPAYVDRLLKAEAMMIALAIRQQRMAASPAAQAAWR